MQTKVLYKFYILFFSLLLVFAANQFGFSAENKQIKNDYIAEGQIIREGNILIIRVPSLPPDNYNSQRNQAFILLYPYLTKNLEKASVIWQKDEFSFTKVVSIANVYIKDYLDKKISMTKFIGYFNLQSIEPAPLHLNKVNKLEHSIVSEELTRKAVILREKADAYRFIGKYDSALRIYNQSLEFNPYDTITLFWLAEIYSAQGSIKLAKEYYTKALSIDPDFIAADKALYKLKLEEINK